MEIKVLSVQQPWAWCIFNAGKNVENRTWETDYRGELYIHASKKFDYLGYQDIFEKVAVPQSLKKFETGGIVGKVNIIGCVKNYNSPWAQIDKFHWVLSRPQEIIFKPIKGQLGIFTRKVDWI